MHLAASREQQVAFVCLPGIWLLLFKCPDTTGHVRITVNNCHDLYNGCSVRTSPLLAFYAEGGEDVRHDGCECELYGVRIGNEL